MSGVICTVNKIDVTEFSTLGIRFTGRTSGADTAVISTALFINFTSYNDLTARSALTYRGMSPTDKLTEIDISAETGMYYIGMFGYTSTSAGTIECEMFEMYLRK